MSADWVPPLLAWYRRAARPMPWRETADPYRVLVSEVMLQQTQVDTVRPYYDRFLARFPTLTDLAAADLEEVLGLWQGLGYYRRAKNLHALARQVGPVGVPASAAELRALPGIGAYTAGAVASIAFGEPVPAVDGNVQRVICRLFALPGDPKRGATAKAIEARLRDAMPASAPGEFNQAVMELGATICGPTRPSCNVCPLAGACLAQAGGEEGRYPETPVRRPPRERTHVCAVVQRDGRTLFGKRPPNGRWAGLWELPRVELDPADDAAIGLAAGLRSSLAVAARVKGGLASHRHGVSGEKILLLAFRVELNGEPEPHGYDDLRWTETPADLPRSSAQQALWRALEQGNLPAIGEE